MKIADTSFNLLHSFVVTKYMSNSSFPYLIKELLEIPLLRNNLFLKWAGNLF